MLGRQLVTFLLKLQVFKYICKSCWLNLNLAMNCLNTCISITSVKWSKSWSHENIVSNVTLLAVVQVFLSVINLFRGMEALKSCCWTGIVRYLVRWACIAGNVLDLNAFPSNNKWSVPSQSLLGRTVESLPLLTLLLLKVEEGDCYRLPM